MCNAALWDSRNGEEREIGNGEGADFLEVVTGSMKEGETEIIGYSIYRVYIVYIERRDH